MYSNTSLKPIDTLIIGHVTSDLQPDGTSKLGGTVSFSGLTSHQLGQKTAILTSNTSESDLSALSALEVACVPSEKNTTFRNIPTDKGRIQYCYSQAGNLGSQDVPIDWRNPKIVHLGPVADEIDPRLLNLFSTSLLCLTPQGFHREIAADGQVSFKDWSEKEIYLPKTDVVVLSLEDLAEDENLVQEYASLCKLLVVTENENGARVYWNQEMRRFPAPPQKVVEETGAGDIFAACFFYRYHTTGDAWQAARFAVELSANSVTRRYFQSIPTREEIENAKRFC